MARAVFPAMRLLWPGLAGARRRRRIAQRRSRDALKMLSADAERRRRRNEIYGRQRQRSVTARRRRSRAHFYRVAGVWLNVVFWSFLAITWASDGFVEWFYAIVD